MKNLEQTVITTSEIVDGLEEITAIYYDNDGIWQALSEQSILDSPKVISIGNLFEIDPSLESVITLMKKGEKAIKKGLKWDIMIDV